MNNEPTVYHPDCKDQCAAGVCQKTWSDPYGCGGCCACLGACYATEMDKLHNRTEAEDAAQDTGEGES